MKLESLGRRFSDEILALTHTEEPRPDADGLDLIDSRALLDADLDQEWHVERILVRGQPAVLGGAKKTLKTSVLVRVLHFLEAHIFGNAGKCKSR